LIVNKPPVLKFSAVSGGLTPTLTHGCALWCLRFLSHLWGGSWACPGAGASPGQQQCLMGWQSQSGELTETRATGLEVL